MKEGPTIFYRTTDSEGGAPRPSWYDKELCLYTLCLAVDAFSLLGIKAKLVVLHDGEIKNNPHQKGIKSLVEPRGEILELLPKLGNSRSCLKALEKAASLSKQEITVFAEDDYLWLLPES
ncbi:hypothetical protein COT65_01750 [Candidatus Shapirobacteria bacterium CG09_land_8_20_14_0_10_47_13]|uniref:Uncharacterized protein n=1 Tax=Candidatus Shapirobacteria bacterium CG09_land_8_20_14_0_10_47_13 TaxID=1974481 RepID=A0A2H0WML4_9BACT|nr:MAG: hypothetical protein COT65_01750 [Candidatus Shapirobacteria bacterium CG09_land_8_20_14_0_10_47_13]